jgi:response regulator NasT
MPDTLSILVIDDNAIRASIIEAGLREAGHERVQIIVDIDDVAERVGAIAPDVVIIDLENPNRDVLEHFFALSRSLKRPIAMFVDKADLS